jgi:hypothetical protein
VEVRGDQEQLSLVESLRHSQLFEKVVPRPSIQRFWCDGLEEAFLREPGSLGFGGSPCGRPLSFPVTFVATFGREFMSEDERETFVGCRGYWSYSTQLSM